ncbi:hypothetical protein ACFQX8_25020 [Klenkia terrae]|uniref:hypothetical protein n=1 Tax=Klenkia terrae TaxID=1052259 RepID=UPI00361053BB
MTDRSRPDLDDTTVEALGKLSEALETVEQARGFLYAFHQLSGKADILLGEALDSFREAGATALADDLERDLLGRDVVADRWTFQVVEDYDDGYWTAFRAADARARTELSGGDRHVLEARMKQRERTPGRRARRPVPGSRPDGRTDRSTPTVGGVTSSSPAADPTPPPATAPAPKRRGAAAWAGRWPGSCWSPSPSSWCSSSSSTPRPCASRWCSASWTCRWSSPCWPPPSWAP